MAANAKDDNEKGNPTPMDSVYTMIGVKEKLGSMLKTIEQGQVNEDLVNEYMPGFTNPIFQGFINKTATQKIYAGSSYTGQTEVEFSIVPPNGTKYNPSSVTLSLQLQLTNSDGSGKMDATTIAVNNFLSVLIKDINIVKYRAEENITPQQPISVAEYCNFAIDKFDSNHFYLAQEVLHVSRKKVKSGRRSNAVGTTDKAIAARTDENIKQRLAKYTNVQNSNNLYTVNLSLLSNFFSINDVLNTPITIRLTLKQDMRKLFESTAPGDLNVSVGNYKITSIPYLKVVYYNVSSMYKNTFNKIFNSKKVYNYQMIPSFNKKIYQLNTGEQDLNIDFIGIPYQYDWIMITVKDRNNDVHSSVYDSYGGDIASSNIEKLTISNLAAGDSLETKTIDMLDADDIHDAYKSYLAYYCKGSSINEPIQYKNSTLIIHQPTEYEFSNNVGYPFLIDTRKSRGYTNLEEKAERSDARLLIRLKLKKAVTTNTTVTVYAIGLAHYKVQILPSGVEMINHFTYSNPAGLRVK